MTLHSIVGYFLGNNAPDPIFQGIAMPSLRNDNDNDNAMAGNRVEAEPNCERRDHRRRDIVDHAIAVQQSRNTMSAVEYLKSHDVAGAVIERVMLGPERRRRNCC